MANYGKFIDRTPIICAAGKSNLCQKVENVSVKDCLTHYPLVDQIAALKNDCKIDDKDRIEHVPQKMLSKRNTGTHTELHEILNPPVPTRYQTLIDDLKCTSYRSYWDEEVGKTRDPTPGLPGGMDPINTTFGIPSTVQDSVKLLVNPDKSFYQVLYDSQDGHSWYRKTHNDYNPSERVCRDYKSPPFDPTKLNGEKSAYDPRGIFVRCACRWCVSEPVIPVSKIQADLLDRKRPKLGRCLTPNNNIECVPKGHMFGKKSVRVFYGVQDLLKDANVVPCLFKRDFLDWMTHLNELREYIKRRRHMFSLKNFYSVLLHYDTDLTGWIELEKLYKITTFQGINFDHDKMEPLIKMLGILCDGYVNYKRFVALIDVNEPTPNISKCNEIPQENINFITTYQEMLNDHCIRDPYDNTEMPVAGIPSRRYDLIRAVVPPEGCKADTESMGDETTAAALLNPHIYANYGLSHHDFFQPRQPDVIKTLFEKLGYQFPDDTFDKLWQIGLREDNTGLVCVDTFKRLLEMSLPPPIFSKVSENERCYQKKVDGCNRIYT